MDLFSDLMNSDWTDLVASKWHRKLKDAHMNKMLELPSMEDMVALDKIVKDDIKHLLQLFQETESPSSAMGRELLEALLIKVILFNKRRGGEAARLKVKTYVEVTTRETSVNDELLCSLSDEERALAKNLYLIYTPGKAARHIGIIMTPEMKTVADLLLQHRDKIVLSSNIYLFGKPGTCTYLKPWDILRRYSEEHDLHLSTTNFRKYLATTAQVLDLPDQEISWLARHLGHSEDVHRQFYRKHNRTIELGKVAKLLIASQTGTLPRYKGQTMGNMKLTDIPDEDWWPAAGEEDSREDNGGEEDGGEDNRGEEDEFKPAPTDAEFSDGSNDSDLDALHEMKGKKRKSKRANANVRRRPIFDRGIEEAERKQIWQYFEGKITALQVPRQKEIRYIQESGSDLN